MSIYHNDLLSAALGTKEHGGRTRGVSKKATFKEGFADINPEMYKKHDLFKQNIRDEAQKVGEESARKICEEYFSSMMQANLGLGIVPSTLQHQRPGSSVASTTDHAPIPDITESTPCDLYMVFGRSGKRKKVAAGMAHPGRELHNKTLPNEYVKVTVK